MQSAKERLNLHMLVEEHFSQVQTQTKSLSGMHFYGMGSPLYTWNVGHTLRVYNRLPMQVHSKFGHGLINFAEMMFYAVRRSF